MELIIVRKNKTNMKKYENYFINFLNLDDNLIYFGVYEYQGLGYNPTLIWDMTFNNGGWLLYTNINIEENDYLTKEDKQNIRNICQNWYKEILKIED